MKDGAANGVDRDLGRLRAWFDRLSRQRGEMPAPQVLVQAPGFTFAYGDQVQQFAVASVSKMMTAVLIMMLVEEGRFETVTPIGDLLPGRDLVGLPAALGVNVATEVTVEQLLTHTSGLPDYFETRRGHDTACSIRGVVADRERVWTPSSMLHEARRLPAVGRPAQRFRYSHTGYLLLGRIAEEAAGSTLAQLLRQRLFVPLGMEHSCTPYDATEMPENLARLDVAPFWVLGHELSRSRSVSADWGGGGVVSTIADLVRLQQAVHHGRLISADSLAWLTCPRHRFRRGIAYGAGMMTLRFGEFAPWLRNLPQPTGSIGVVATHLVYFPEHDAHVVLNFHSTQQMRQSFAAQLRISSLVARAA